MIPPDENAMQKEGEAVRKSNVIIIAILMVASIAFLWLWNYLGFHLIDMRDLVITILWWIITIGLCIAIHIAEKRRRERIRTIFISDGVLYTPRSAWYVSNPTIRRPMSTACASCWTTSTTIPT